MSTYTWLSGRNSSSRSRGSPVSSRSTPCTCSGAALSGRTSPAHTAAAANHFSCWRCSPDDRRNRTTSENADVTSAPMNSVMPTTTSASAGSDATASGLRPDVHGP
jgi:hypothetical protein